jgi:GT2 family glycosyltransferase
VSVLFSVVVPTYERVASMRRCLAALAQLEYPRASFEVIVVDDGSATPLAEAIPASVDGLAVTIVRIPNSGPGAARNAGAACARGRVLAFTDDDCQPAPSWLANLAASWERAPACLIGGRTVNALARNPWSVTSQVIVDMAYAFYNADVATPRFFASNNMAIPADLFAKLGGFRGGPFRVASEDRELCDRWRHAGYGLAYAPAAVVAHAHALELRSFCRQHFRYGRGAMRYHQVRAQRRSGHFRQDVRFYLEMPRLLRQATAGLGAWRAATVVPRLMLWQLCNAAGYLYERGRAPEPEAPGAATPPARSSA